MAKAFDNDYFESFLGGYSFTGRPEDGSIGRHIRFTDAEVGWLGQHGYTLWDCCREKEGRVEMDGHLVDGMIKYKMLVDIGLVQKRLQICLMLMGFLLVASEARPLRFFLHISTVNKETSTLPRPLYFYFMLSIQMVGLQSLGTIKLERGDNEISVILGPSGEQERLN